MLLPCAALKPDAMNEQRRDDQADAAMVYWDRPGDRLLAEADRIIESLKSGQRRRLHPLRPGRGRWGAG